MDFLGPGTFKDPEGLTAMGLYVMIPNKSVLMGECAPTEGSLNQLQHDSAILNSICTRLSDMSSYQRVDCIAQMSP